MSIIKGSDADLLDELYREYDRMVIRGDPQASTQKSIIREYEAKKEKKL